MAATVRFRSDFDGVELRRLTRANGDAKQIRQLLALAAIYEGATRSEAARVGEVKLGQVHCKSALAETINHALTR